MIKEEFYNLATNRPEIVGDSVYTLMVREIDNNYSGFIKDTESGDWYYEINFRDNWYTSKEMALEYMKRYIQNDIYNKRIHSFLIQRRPANVPLEDRGLLEWWLYDNNGKEIDMSVCAWELIDKPKFQDVFLGRHPENLRFKMGEIVEIIHNNRVFLSVINGLPTSVDEMWKIYDERFKKEGLNLDERILRGDFFDAMADRYYYIQSNGYDPDTSPDCILKPSFPVPNEAKDILSSRYNRWKSYIDSHPPKEINWDELYEIVKGTS